MKHLFRACFKMRMLNTCSEKKFSSKGYFHLLLHRTLGEETKNTLKPSTSNTYVEKPIHGPIRMIIDRQPFPQYELLVKMSPISSLFSLNFLLTCFVVAAGWTVWTPRTWLLTSIWRHFQATTDWGLVFKASFSFCLLRKGRTRKETTETGKARANKPLSRP